MSQTPRLTWSKANTKTEKLADVLGIKRSEVKGFSLPAGWTCPAAVKCLAKADRLTGKLTDGPQCEYRCFSASTEAQYPNTRKMVWRNLDVLRSAGLTDSCAMAQVILHSLPKRAKVIRIHIAGDFFNAEYLRAWVTVAQAKPDVVFYGYTKNFQVLKPFLVAGEIPANLRIMYSHGGRDDALAAEYGYPTAYVVMTPTEAAERGLPIDHTDALAYHADQDIALLIHGPQKAGSAAGKASRKNRMRKWK